jgi:hypothetical protein
MAKNVYFLLCLCVVLVILTAGCASTTEVNSAGTVITPSTAQPEFNNGDVIGTGASSATGVTVVSFDSSVDSYTVENAIKNADGSWEISNMPEQRTLSRTIVEKLYPTKIGTMSGLTQTSENTASNTQVTSAGESTGSSSSSSASSSDLQLVGAQMIAPTNPYGFGSVDGTIKNNGGKTYSYVQVTVNLYDSTGAEIGSTMANINNLESGGTWKFSAPVLVKGVSSYKVMEITGF